VEGGDLRSKGLSQWGMGGSASNTFRDAALAGGDCGGTGPSGPLKRSKRKKKPRRGEGKKKIGERRRGPSSSKKKKGC